MSINVISMLTLNDKTVPNALEIFNDNKHAKTTCWGFKDIGITYGEAAELVQAMKAAGKTTFLEPLLEDDESCINVSQMAVRCGVDCVVGMVFNKRACEMLKDAGIQYYPTCGRRAGLPRMLYGSQDEIISDAHRLINNHGIEGVCLSSYRYVDGEPEGMTLALKRSIQKKIIISGGIDSFSRLNFIKQLNPWGFTIGSALFKGKFGTDKSIAQQLDIIQNYIES